MITKEQYGEWRNSPATQFFRQFLRDRRATLIQASTEAWLNSPATFEADSAQARGRILELFDIEAASFDQIETFYREKDNEAKDIDD